VEMYAWELGIDLARDLTVTGGMPFAGGPYNNYVLQATARMAELLRAGNGRHGLVASVSGVLTKQGFGLWSRAPGPAGFVHADVSDAAARATPVREIVAEHVGAGVVAGYTVLHESAHAPQGVVVVDLPDRRRAVAHSDDAAVVAAMEAREFCGTAVVLGAGSTFTPQG
jgi:acetyl-CoA C-acetyltransferase